MFNSSGWCISSTYLLYPVRIYFTEPGYKISANRAVYSYGICEVIVLFFKRFQLSPLYLAIFCCLWLDWKHCSGDNSRLHIFQLHNQLQTNKLFFFNFLIFDWCPGLLGHKIKTIFDVKHSLCSLFFYNKEVGKTSPCLFKFF